MINNKESEKKVRNQKCGVIWKFKLGKKVRFSKDLEMIAQLIDLISEEHTPRHREDVKAVNTLRKLNAFWEYHLAQCGRGSDPS